MAERTLWVFCWKRVPPVEPVEAVEPRWRALRVELAAELVAESGPDGPGRRGAESGAEAPGLRGAEIAGQSPVLMAGVLLMLDMGFPL